MSRYNRVAAWRLDYTRQGDLPLNAQTSPLSRTTYLSLLLLSAATLVFEINLTRLFSVAQFYHFAFMIVSLALLGFGASGTALALFPHWGRGNPARGLSRLALGAGLSILGAYLLTNWVPFDSFSIAWDRRQVYVLALHYLALATPFFFSGVAVGLLLTAYPQNAGGTYAVNLVGSALGCVVALAAPSVLGGEGTVMLSSGMAALAALIAPQKWPVKATQRVAQFRILLTVCLLAFSLLDLGIRLAGGPSFSFLELQISPYKSLSYALQYPGAEVTSRRWNAFSRVDLVSSPGVRSLPGLSFDYLKPPPPEDGLLVDGDDLSPVVLPGAGLDFTAYLPSALAFQLHPEANTLILEPRGGLDVLVALSEGARRVTAVEYNPLIVEAAAHVYEDPRVEVVVEANRSYLQRSGESFDVVMLSLVTTYHPVRSGAYSLGEDYRYTVEAFEDALARLNPDGLLVVNRWLQVPPSEFLRAFALAVTALENAGLDPAGRIVALRSFNLGTLLVKPTPFTGQELSALRDFAARLTFDLVYTPDLRPEEVNRYSVMEEPLYYQAFTDLLAAQDRAAWYAAYPYDVAPPTDDHPFFGHFFKWSQAGQVLAELGRVWQPFGGAGYFVLAALLALALIMAGGIILMPIGVARWRKSTHEAQTKIPPRLRWAGLGYFGLIGLAYLLVEIPLIQHFILYLGHPSYALTTVLFSLLLFSGLGSQRAYRIPHRPAMAVLVGLAVGTPWLLPAFFDLTLGFSLAVRLAVTVLILAPLGFLMGIPFPRGVGKLEAAAPGLIPWIWGVNGAASVVSSMLAALLALSFGFRVVLLLGAACYAGAWLVIPALTVPRIQSPRP